MEDIYDGNGLIDRSKFKKQENEFIQTIIDKDENGNISILKGIHKQCDINELFQFESKKTINKLKKYEPKGIDDLSMV
jgi:DNA polymerase III alpha subunit